MPRPPNPWATIAPLLTPKVVAKFWAHVKIGTPDECWPWQGQINQYGYGMFYVSGRRTGVMVHRMAVYVSTGFMADDKFACHTCDNRPCCNPAHLWLGTHQENLRDMWTKGRANPQGPFKRKVAA